ncbi:uncharacterized protein LOC131931287 [Physella acuta]|uniref:uncharacterized protein LOC131931287 n=1 Tax=Physella acuta TaxID=109671 RepID=UPI0027DBE5D8|nr:uncharacterized protein LOC131931287 [Physella acuta]
MNSTNSTLIKKRYDFSTVINVMIASDSFVVILGAVINVWLVAAILSSPELRARFRNKIIVCLSVCFLTESFLRAPIELVVHSSFKKRRKGFGCLLMSVMANIQLLQDFISNWYVVMLLLVFVAQIKDINPRAKLQPLAITFGTAVVLFLPWLLSLITIPSVMSSYSRVFVYNSTRYWSSCIYPTSESLLIFKSLDSAVPLLTTLVLMILAIVFRRQRFRRGFSATGMRVELISQGPAIDTLPAYIALVTTAIFCNVIDALLCFDVIVIAPWQRLYFIIVSHVVSDTRAYLMPLTWLLVPEIRDRLKTWRPWYRPGKGIDLTVSFDREQTA